MIEKYRELTARREGRKEGLKKCNNLLGSVFTEGKVRISREKETKARTPGSPHTLAVINSTSVLLRGKADQILLKERLGQAQKVHSCWLRGRPQHSEDRDPSPLGQGAVPDQRCGPAARPRALPGQSLCRKAPSEAESNPAPLMLPGPASEHLATPGPVSGPL